MSRILINMIQQLKDDKLKYLLLRNSTHRVLCFMPAREYIGIETMDNGAISTRVLKSSDVSIGEEVFYIHSDGFGPDNEKELNIQNIRVISDGETIDFLGTREILTISNYKLGYRSVEDFSFVFNLNKLHPENCPPNAGQERTLGKFVFEDKDSGEDAPIRYKSYMDFVINHQSDYFEAKWSGRAMSSLYGEDYMAIISGRKLLDSLGCERLHRELHDIFEDEQGNGFRNHWRVLFEYLMLISLNPGLVIDMLEGRTEEVYTLLLHRDTGAFPEAIQSYATKNSKSDW